MSSGGAGGGPSGREPSSELGIEGVTGASRIGRGGFGVVYKAEQTAFGRTVAVKVMSAPDLDEDARRRFEQECRAIGALSGHPYVVAIYDSGRTSGGQPYLVLDYLPGGTLGQRIAGRGPLPWPEVADIGVKLAGALASAHAVGVLHRDVKPENVLISSYGEPQLSDFGVARIQGGTETASGVITGSLAHAAPEVLSGRPASEASDVYSLASTLYALAAGHAPFVRPGDETFHPLLTRIMTEDPPDLRPAVPDPLWEVVAAALARDPARRTPTALAFGEALRSAQEATGMRPTPLVAPQDVVVGPAPPVEAPDPAGVTRLRERPWSAAPAPPPPPAADDRRDHLRKPWVLALAVVAALLLVASAALAMTRGDGDEDETVLRTSRDTVVTSTTLPPVTSTVPTAVTTPSVPPLTLAPPPAAGRAPAGGAPVASPAPPAPGGALPACTPSFFRVTVSTDRPAYRPGETMRATARFENVSGRACAYPRTSASSEVLNAAGQVVTPPRTLDKENTQMAPFEPGTSQEFVTSWGVVACTTDPSCLPGRYTVAMNVVPFGGGRASFDVSL